MFPGVPGSDDASSTAGSMNDKFRAMTRKMSLKSSDSSQIDLSLTSEENERNTGLGIHNSYSMATSVTTESRRPSYVAKNNTGWQYSTTGVGIGNSLGDNVGFAFKNTTAFVHPHRLTPSKYGVSRSRQHSYVTTTYSDELDEDYAERMNSHTSDGGWKMNWNMVNGSRNNSLSVPSVSSGELSMPSSDDASSRLGSFSFPDPARKQSTISGPIPEEVIPESIESSPSTIPARNFSVNSSTTARSNTLTLATVDDVSPSATPRITDVFIPTTTPIRLTFGMPIAEGDEEEAEAKSEAVPVFSMPTFNEAFDETNTRSPIQEDCEPGQKLPDATIESSRVTEATQTTPAQELNLTVSVANEVLKPEEKVDSAFAETFAPNPLHGEERDSIRSNDTGSEFVQARSRASTIASELNVSPIRISTPRKSPSRMSFDKTFNFLVRDTEPETASTRANKIRAARKAFEDKEASKQRKYDREQAKRDEWKRRTSETVEWLRRRKPSNAVDSAVDTSALEQRTPPSETFDSESPISQHESPLQSPGLEPTLEELDFQAMQNDEAPRQQSVATLAAGSRNQVVGEEAQEVDVQESALFSTVSYEVVSVDGEAPPQSSHSQASSTLWPPLDYDSLSYVESPGYRSVTGFDFDRPSSNNTDHESIPSQHNVKSSRPPRGKFSRLSSWSKSRLLRV